jgi:hypothetical protein
MHPLAIRGRTQDLVHTQAGVEQNAQPVFSSITQALSVFLIISAIPVDGSLHCRMYMWQCMHVQRSSDLQIGCLGRTLTHGWDSYILPAER